MRAGAGSETAGRRAPSRAPSRLDTAARVTAAVFGAYGFAWGLAAFGAELGALAGLAPADAVTASGLLALLVLPVAGLWAFAAPRAAVGWAVLGGGGVLLIVAAQLAGSMAP